MIESYLARLDAYLSENNPEFYSRLLPGLSDSDFSLLESQMGVTLPTDFRALYAWRNGQPSGDEESLMQDCSTFLNMNEILIHWKEAENIYSSNIGNRYSSIFGNKFYWNAKWVPFLDRHDGNLLCVDTIGVFSGNSGQLIEFAHNDDSRIVLAPNIEVFLQALVEGLQYGAFEEGHLMMDIVRHIASDFPRAFPE